LGMVVNDSNKIKKLVDFLEEKQNDIVEDWFSSLKLENINQIGGEKVKENGTLVFKLVIKSVINPLADTELKELANTIAKERAEANINIGDFVYNVIRGRSVLFHFIHQWGIPFDELYGGALDDISTLFDRFCYHVVKKYTEIKERELQEKVIFIDKTHKDRLTLLGQMSSSFVHEFRNPLTAIMGFIKLLKSGADNHMYLDIIDHELQQLNFRITQFLHTSRREIQEKDKEELFIPVMVNEILDFLYPIIVDVDCELSNNTETNLKIFAYKDELKQVIQNILLNSVDAVKEKEKPRKISIHCGAKENQVFIRIANNGPMIPSKTIKTIFEPFFTTKELGTGIGLYVCKKIIEKHNGSIVCDSNESWTTFSIYLPLEEQTSDRA
jgi:signal transduction histidine kinase